jgi:hypothetical protein
LSTNGEDSVTLENTNGVVAEHVLPEKTFPERRHISRLLLCVDSCAEEKNDERCEPSDLV